MVAIKTASAAIVAAQSILSDRGATTVPTLAVQPRSLTTATVEYSAKHNNLSNAVPTVTKVVEAEDRNVWPPVWMSNGLTISTLPRTTPWTLSNSTLAISNSTSMNSNGPTHDPSFNGTINCKGYGCPRTPSTPIPMWHNGTFLGFGSSSGTNSTGAPFQIPSQPKISLGAQQLNITQDPLMTDIPVPYLPATLQTSDRLKVSSTARPSLVSRQDEDEEEVEENEEEKEREKELDEDVNFAVETCHQPCVSKAEAAGHFPKGLPHSSSDLQSNDAYNTCMLECLILEVTDPGSSIFGGPKKDDIDASPISALDQAPSTTSKSFTSTASAPTSTITDQSAPLNREKCLKKCISQRPMWSGYIDPNRQDHKYNECLMHCEQENLPKPTSLSKLASANSLSDHNNQKRNQTREFDEELCLRNCRPKTYHILFGWKYCDIICELEKQGRWPLHKPYPTPSHPNNETVTASPSTTISAEEISSTDNFSISANQKRDEPMFRWGRCLRLCRKKNNFWFLGFEFCTFYCNMRRRGMSFPPQMLQSSAVHIDGNNVTDVASLNASTSTTISTAELASTSVPSSANITKRDGWEDLETPPDGKIPHCVVYNCVQITFLPPRGICQVHCTRSIEGDQSPPLDTVTTTVVTAMPTTLQTRTSPAPAPTPALQARTSEQSRYWAICRRACVAHYPPLGKDSQAWYDACASLCERDIEYRGPHANVQHNPVPASPSIDTDVSNKTIAVRMPVAIEPDLDTASANEGYDPHSQMWHVCRGSCKGHPTPKGVKRDAFLNACARLCEAENGLVGDVDAKVEVEDMVGSGPKRDKCPLECRGTKSGEKVEGEEISEKLSACEYLCLPEELEKLEE